MQVDPAFFSLREDIQDYRNHLYKELSKPPRLRSRDRIRSYRESIRNMEYSLAEVAGMSWINNLETWVRVVSHTDGV